MRDEVSFFQPGYRGILCRESPCRRECLCPLGAADARCSPSITWCVLQCRTVLHKLAWTITASFPVRGVL